MNLSNAAVLALSAVIALASACDHGGGLDGVYLQGNAGHTFTALKFYQSGEVDISDSHVGILKVSYKAEADSVTLNLGRHPIILRLLNDGCWDGGPMIGIFCKAPRRK